MNLEAVLHPANSVNRPWRHKSFQFLVLAAVDPFLACAITSDIVGQIFEVLQTLAFSGTAAVVSLWLFALLPWIRPLLSDSMASARWWTGPVKNIPASDHKTCLLLRLCSLKTQFEMTVFKQLIVKLKLMYLIKVGNTGVKVSKHLLDFAASLGTG